MFVHTSARVTHKDPNIEWIESYTYTDGLGRVALTKAQAEPGDAPQRDANGLLVRDTAGGWRSPPPTAVGGHRPRRLRQQRQPRQSLRTILRHQLLPTTDETDLVESGVTAITRYDPLGRVIRVDNPNGTYRTVEVDPWQTLISDENDTVLTSVWYAARSSGQLGPAESRRRQQGRRAPDTPSTTNSDTLGRVVPDRRRQRYGWQIYNHRHPRHPRPRSSHPRRPEPHGSHPAYDMIGTELHQLSLDAGERWLLTDATGQLLQAWDSRGYTVTARYDAAAAPYSAHSDRSHWQPARRRTNHLGRKPARRTGSEPARLSLPALRPSRPRHHRPTRLQEQHRHRNTPTRRRLHQRRRLVHKPVTQHRYLHDDQQLRRPQPHHDQHRARWKRHHFEIQ